MITAVCCCFHMLYYSMVVTRTPRHCNSFEKHITVSLLKVEEHTFHRVMGQNILEGVVEELLCLLSPHANKYPSIYP